MPAVDQAPPHGAIVDPSELAAVPGSMLDAAKAYAADVLSLPAEPAPRTLPVTPAERALAACLRAWLSFRESPWQSSPVTEALVRIGSALKIAGVLCGTLGKREITPAGRDLLARAEATRSAEHIARELVIKLQTSGAPGVLVSEAQSVLVNVRARAARLAAAPPAKEPR
jgi:hypothetical protein